MSLWETVTWDVARAGGFTAFGLLTLSIAIGLALTLHWQSPRWPRIINSELHNFLTLLALIFTGIHVLTLLLYGLVVVHGIATGRDTRTWWGAAIYASSGLLVGTLLWQRLKKPANAQSSAHPVLAVASVATKGIVAFWTMLGTLQPGWNTIANNGNGSGATSKAVAAQAKQPSTAQQPSTNTPQSFSG